MFGDVHFQTWNAFSLGLLSFWVPTSSFQDKWNAPQGGGVGCLLESKEDSKHHRQEKKGQEQRAWAHSRWVSNGKQEKMLECSWVLGQVRVLLTPPSHRSCVWNRRGDGAGPKAFGPQKSDRGYRTGEAAGVWSDTRMNADATNTCQQLCLQQTVL